MQSCCQRQRKWKPFAWSLPAWCIQISNEGPSSLWSLCRLEKEWRAPHHRRTSAFEAADPVALAKGQSFARVDVDTNDPIFVGGVDIHVAFYAAGLAEAFQDLFALDPVEAWEVDFACVVDQGVVCSWNEVAYPVLAVVRMGWNQALNVCQRVN